jgi:hypothetical protein
MKIKAVFGMTAFVLILNVQASADDTSALNTEASRMNTLAVNHGESNVTGKIAGLLTHLWVQTRPPLLLA